MICFKVLDQMNDTLQQGQVLHADGALCGNGSAAANPKAPVSFWNARQTFSIEKIRRTHAKICCRYIFVEYVGSDFTGDTVCSRLFPSTRLSSTCADTRAQPFLHAHIFML